MALTGNSLQNNFLPLMKHIIINICFRKMMHFFKLPNIF